jgi:hypothetical protein
VNIGRNISASLILIGVLSFLTPTTFGNPVPTSTTIPVIFTRTLDASKAKVGDEATMKTTQVVQLGDGRQLPKDTTLLGHVTEARAFSFDPTPYAAQRPSLLAIQIDKVVTQEGTMPITVSIRALASTFDSDAARRPRYTDDTDMLGTMVAVGGDASYYPISKEVVNRDGDIVGYHRKDGVYAHLLPSEYHSRYSSFDCDGSQTEQSVGIYSPSACGLYGFDASVYLAENGFGNPPGTFRLESRHRTIKLYAHTTALVQVISFPGRSATTGK